MSLTARTLASCLLFSLFVGPLGAQHLLVWPSDRSTVTRDLILDDLASSDLQVLVRNPHDGSAILHVTDALASQLERTPGLEVQRDLDTFPTLLPESVRVLAFVQPDNVLPSPVTKDRATADLEDLGAIEVWRSRHTHAVQYDVPFARLPHLNTVASLEHYFFNKIGVPSTAQSIPLVMPNTSATHWGATWGDYLVAVIDTGVKSTYSGLSGRVNTYWAACFSNNGVPGWASGTWASTCPNGASEAYGGTAGEQACPTCTHGTAVASVIASDATEGGLIEASAVEIVPIQVYTLRTSGGTPGAPNLVPEPASKERTEMS
jgi:hypothetical protein